MFGGPEVVKQFAGYPVLMFSVLVRYHCVDDVNETGLLYIIYR